MRVRRYSAIQGPFEKGEFSPRPPGQARVQNGKKGEEGRRANLSTLTAAAFSLPSIPLPVPCSFLPFPAATFIFHCFHPFWAKQERRFVHCSEKTCRICPPRDGAPIFSLSRSLDVTTIPFVSGESNVVWQWHQLNGWPLRALPPHNKWASSAIADGKEEEACSFT